jgi:hypothetical protein
MLRQKPAKLSSYLHLIARTLLVIAVLLYLFSSNVSYGLGAVGLVLEVAGWIVMVFAEEDEASKSENSNNQGHSRKE